MGLSKRAVCIISTSATQQFARRAEAHSKLHVRCAVLPDLVIRHSPFDEPLHFTGVDAAPWAGYCMVPQQQRMLLLPDTLRCSTSVYALLLFGSV